MNRIVRSIASRPRRRHLYAILIVALLAPLFFVSTSQANPPQNSGLFELDKNAQNNVSTSLLGSL